MWFYVAGILKPAPLTPEIDSEVLVGFAAAEKYLGFDGHPSEIYVKVEPTSETASGRRRACGDGKPRIAERSRRLPAVRRARCTGRRPGRPQRALPRSRRGGAAGRRGWRREHHGDLGAGATMRDRPSSRAWRDQGNIRTQFLSEAILLALLGGAVGILLGVLSTAIYASTKHWGVVIPPLAWGGGIGARSLSAPSPGCGRRCGQRGCPRPRRYGACEENPRTMRRVAL